MPRLLLKAEHYPLLEAAVAYLESHYREQPSLDQIAAQVGLSPAHFQRLFKEGVGISPKRFLQYTTLRHARELLQTAHPVLETSYAVGLSGSSRLHDLFVQCQAMTPGEVRQRGAGLVLRYGVHTSPLGQVLLVSSDKGICEMSFLPDRRHKANQSLQMSLQQKWPGAELWADEAVTGELVQQVFAEQPSGPLNLFLCGTNFQIQVWQALLRIPQGALVAYGDLCRYLEKPQAARAVGSAVGQNPISYLIPCHRVLRQDGQIGGYAGGTARKRILLALEASAG